MPSGDVSNRKIEELVEDVLAGRMPIDACHAAHPGLATDITVSLLGKAILEPEIEFRESLRRSIVAETQEMRSSRGPQAERVFPGIFRKRAFGVAAAAVCIALLLSGIALASSSSLPNSPLYPIKLTIEEVTMAMQMNPSAKAKLHLSLARKRVQEMRSMISSGDYDSVQMQADTINEHLNKAAIVAEELTAKERDAVLVDIESIRRALSDLLAKLPGRNEKLNMKIDEPGVCYGNSSKNEPHKTCVAPNEPSSGGASVLKGTALQESVIESDGMRTTKNGYSMWDENNVDCGSKAQTLTSNSENVNQATTSSCPPGNDTPGTSIVDIKYQAPAAKTGGETSGGGGMAPSASSTSATSEQTSQQSGENTGTYDGGTGARCNQHPSSSSKRMR